MEPDMEGHDGVGEMPVRCISYQRNQNDYVHPQPRYNHRKDSVVSYSPSTNSQTPMVEISKHRSISQSSCGSSNDSGSTTPSTLDKVQITKLKLYIRVGLGFLIPVVIILFIAVIYLFIAVLTLQNIRYPDHDNPRFGKQTDPESDKEPLCIECKKLQFTLTSENIILDKLIKKIEGGKQICCAETAEQTDIFMKRVSPRWFYPWHVF
jgi:hypothetical protein